MASDIGVINKGGAWYTLTTVENQPKFQGVEKVRAFLVDNEEVFQNLYKQVKETMGMKV